MKASLVQIPLAVPGRDGAGAEVLNSHAADEFGRLLKDRLDLRDD